MQLAASSQCGACRCIHHRTASNRQTLRALLMDTRAATWGQHVDNGHLWLVPLAQFWHQSQPQWWQAAKLQGSSYLISQVCGAQVLKHILGPPGVNQKSCSCLWHMTWCLTQFGPCFQVQCPFHHAPGRSQLWVFECILALRKILLRCENNIILVGKVVQWVTYLHESILWYLGHCMQRQHAWLSDGWLWLWWKMLQDAVSNCDKWMYSTDANVHWCSKYFTVAVGY